MKFSNLNPFCISKEKLLLEVNDIFSISKFGKNGFTNKSIFLLSKLDFLCAKVPSTKKSSFFFLIDTFSEEIPILSNLKLRSFTKNYFYYSQK